jgi:hypothetical protein
MPKTKEQIKALLCDACCPVGHLYALVVISITKRMLAMEIPAEYRLKFLEHLDKNASRDPWLNAEMIAAIEPICNKGYEIVREANKLGPKAIDVYAANFSTFAVLNPSLVVALQMSPTYWTRSEHSSQMGAPASH